MIEIFEGRIGGGKTYTAVQRILDAVKSGQTVFTNVDLNEDYIIKYTAARFGVMVDRDQLQTLPDNVFGWHTEIRWGMLGCPTLVIIDEAHLWYNSRDWNKTNEEHKDMLRFLTQSRKANVDVIFITQISANLDKQFRLLAQYTWSLRDMARVPFGIFGTIFKPFIMFVQRDYEGMTLSSGLKLKSQHVFKSYDTSAFLSPEMEKVAQREREKALDRRVMRKVSLKQRFLFLIGKAKVD